MKENKKTIKILSKTATISMMFAVINTIVAFILIATNWKTSYSDLSFVMNAVTIVAGFIGLFVFIIAYNLCNVLKENNSSDS